MPRASLAVSPQCSMYIILPFGYFLVYRFCLPTGSANLFSICSSRSAVVFNCDGFGTTYSPWYPGSMCEFISRRVQMVVELCDSMPSE